MCCNNTANSNNAPIKLKNTQLRKSLEHIIVKMCWKGDRIRDVLKEHANVVFLKNTPLWCFWRTRQRVVLRDDDLTIPYMVNRGLHSKHHATFLTGPSPVAVSCEAKGFKCLQNSFFKKITLKYNIYNELYSCLLEEAYFTTTRPGRDDSRFWLN